MKRGSTIALAILGIAAAFGMWRMRRGGEPAPAPARHVQVVRDGCTPFELAVDAARVYWLSETGVYAVDKRGGPVATLARTPTLASGIAVDADYVYWTSAAGGIAAINRVAKTGNAVMTLVEVGSSSAGKHVAWALPEALAAATAPFDAPVGADRLRHMLATLAVDDHALYWLLPGTYARQGPSLDNADGEVNAVAKGGGTVVELAAGQRHPSSIAVDDTRVFWTTADAVNAVAKAGGPVVILAAGQHRPDMVVADRDHVYWTSDDEAHGYIETVAKAGGDVTMLDRMARFPVAVAVDPTAVYWLDADVDRPDHALKARLDRTETLHRRPKVGGDEREIGSTFNSMLSSRHPIAADDTGVYWPDVPANGGDCGGAIMHSADGRARTIVAAWSGS